MDASPQGTTIEAMRPLRQQPLVNATFTGSSLGRICTLVRIACADANVTPRNTEDLLIAVSEIAINAVSHGGGSGAITVQLVPGGLIAEIHDDGPGLPTAPSRERPPAGGAELHGLGLARLMCTEFDLVSSAYGVTVRMFTAIGRSVGTALTSPFVSAPESEAGHGLATGSAR